MRHPWYIGVGEVTLVINKYREGTQEGSITLQYKTGDSQVNCIADTWHNYTGSPLDSEGWILIKVLRS